MRVFTEETSPLTSSKSCFIERLGNRQRMVIYIQWNLVRNMIKRENASTVLKREKEVYHQILMRYLVDFACMPQVHCIK